MTSAALDARYMPNGKYALCPYCGCILSRTRYDKHLENQHSPVAEARKRMEAEKRRLEMDRVVNCKICGVAIISRKLPGHISKKHATTAALAVSTVANEARHENILSPCSCEGNNENCFKCFGSGFYEKTLASKSTADVNQKNTIRSAPKSKSWPTGYSSDSRGNDYSIRESGRFLSNPLHDDYGDES